MDDFSPILGVGKRKYFSLVERKRLEKLVVENLKLAGLGEKRNSVRSMARTLGRSHQSVLEELGRKPEYDRYRAEWAERDSLTKQENKGNVRKLDKDPRLRAAVIEGISKDSSPEQVAERIRLMGAELGVRSTVSHETVYRFLYSDPEAKERKLCAHLRTNRPKRKKRGKGAEVRTRVPYRVGIVERPEYVNRRKEFGHFETDSVIFPKGKAILSVQCERMSGLARLTKLPDKTALSTASALRSLANEFD